MSSPIRCKAPPQHRQLLCLDIDQVDPRQVSRAGAQIAPAYSWPAGVSLLLEVASSAASAAASVCSKVLQAELQLIGVEPLGAA